MSDKIPDDVWACGYWMKFTKGGRRHDAFFAFLLRGQGREAVELKLDEIVKHDAERVGAEGEVEAVYFVSREPGEGAVGGLSNMPLFKVSP